MQGAKLSAMTVDQLVKRFVEIAQEQDEALLMNDTAKFNALYWQMDAVKEELKMRVGDQRRALLSLYNHPNMQVRVKAAKATLAIAPQAARTALEAIKASEWQPQALEADMSLWNLDRGIFKPT